MKTEITIQIIRDGKFGQRLSYTAPSGYELGYIIENDCGSCDTVEEMEANLKRRYEECGMPPYYANFKELEDDCCGVDGTFDDVRGWLEENINCFFGKFGISCNFVETK